MPEIRRIIDWRSSFHALSVLSVVPLASLLPSLLLLPQDWSKVGSVYARITAGWLLAFGYALIISLANHGLLSPIYATILFCLPIAFGLTISSVKDPDITRMYCRLSDSLLLLMTVSAVYGLYQYVSPPPWDVYWAQQADVEGSQGATVAFGFRIFGTLNSTGPFAAALIMTMLFNLPRLSLRRWYAIAAYVPMSLALALTSVRSCWIGLAIGVVLYVAFAANRKVILSSIVAIAVVIAISTALISATVKDAAIALNTINARITSFSSLDYDNSTDVRKAETAEAYSQSLEQPLGLGLGTVGTATKLSSGSTISLDNGYLARLVEMGFFGFAVYLICLTMGVVYAFKAYRLARHTQQFQVVDILAVTLCAQIVLLSLEAASDSHLGFSGMFFWAALAITSRFLDQQKKLAQNLRMFSSVSRPETMTA